LVKSQRAGERVLCSISRFLQNRLKLVVNATKSHVVKTSESKFLGFTFRRGRIQWHPKTLKTFKQQIRRLTNRNWGYRCDTNCSKPASLYAAGSMTLALPTAISFVLIWITGYDAE